MATDESPQQRPLHTKAKVQQTTFGGGSGMAWAARKPFSSRNTFCCSNFETILFPFPLKEEIGRRFFTAAASCDHPPPTNSHLPLVEPPGDASASWMFFLLLLLLHMRASEHVRIAPEEGCGPSSSYSRACFFPSSISIFVIFFFSCLDARNSRTCASCILLLRQSMDVRMQHGGEMNS